MSAGTVSFMTNLDHGDPGDAPTVPPPLTEIVNATRPSAAEEARTAAASTNMGTLATLTKEGDPWASFVTYGLVGGAPVLCVSHMAEHGRNLARDRRASIAIVAPDPQSDPLASTRITLAGYVEHPEGDELAAAREAHLTAVPAARIYIDFSDFSLWVLRVQRVRWVGGYGRMDSATAEAYAEHCRIPLLPRPVARSRTSTPTTPTRCRRWLRSSADSRMPPRPPVSVPIATGWIWTSRPRVVAP